METNETHWSGAILYSLAWLISCLLVIVDVLAIREVSLDVLTLIQVRRIENAPAGSAGLERLESGFSMEAIDQGLLFFGGIAAVGLAIGLEYYFRLGRQKGELVQRVIRAGGILIAIFVVSLIIERLI